jgi:hypothetical protein
MADIKIVLTGVDNATDDIKKVEAEISKATAKVKEMEKATKSGESGWTTFNNALGTVEKALGMLGQAYSAVIAPMVEYATQVTELSRVTGQSMEDTSKLIQISDDLFIEFGSLAAAARVAATKGIEFSTEKLAELSDEYLDLQPGVERADYLLTKFGKSGLEMGKLMEQGGDAIREMSDAVADNMKITEKDAYNVKEYKQALDGWNDSVAGLSNELSKGLIPVMTTVVGWGNQLAQQFTDLTKMTGLLSNSIILRWAADQRGISVAQMKAKTEEYDLYLQKKQQESLAATGKAIDQNSIDLEANAKASDEWAKKLSAAAKQVEDSFMGGMGAVQEMVSGRMGQAFESYDEKSKKLKDESAALKTELQLLASQGYSPLGETMQGVSDKISKNGEEQRKLKTEMDKTTQSMIFQKLSANMTAGAAALLASDMGLLSEKDAALIVQADKVTTSLDANRDGVVSLSEYMQGDGKKAIEDYTKTMQENSGQTYTNTFIMQYKVSGNYNMADYQAAMNGGGGWMPDPYNLSAEEQAREDAARIIRGFANGGNFTVPSGYPNDSYLMGVTSGEHVSVTPQGKAGANITVNVNWGGGGSQMDAKNFAKYLRDEIRKQVQYA